MENQSVNSLHDAFMQLVAKPDEFIIDFDEAWQWIGYSSKHKALEMMEKNGGVFTRRGENLRGKRG
jgi:hypothetical protein